jgi:acyl transferase domain-containing protein
VKWSTGIRPCLAAPSGLAQRAVIAAAVRGMTDRSPGVMGGVSMHGTGTALGDPIEVGAIRAAVSATASLVLSASKSRVGHAEAAAGATAMLQARPHFHVPF